MELRCTGRLRIEVAGRVEELELGALSFVYVDTFEPSLVEIHHYDAPLPGGGTARVDVVEDGTGYLFATLALRDGARLLEAEGLAATCDGIALELRVATR